MWTLVTRVSLLFPLSLSFMRSTRTTTDDLNFLYRNFIVFSVVVYFIGEYALSLCEYSSNRAWTLPLPAGLSNRR